MKNLKRFLNEYGEIIRQIALCIVVMVVFFLLFGDAVKEAMQALDIQNY